MDATSSDAEWVVTVVGRRHVADGVMEFVLEPAAGQPPLPGVEAGAHIDVVLCDGLIRQYSLVLGPSDPGRWTIAVLREPVGRGGSRHMHETVGVGSVLTVRGPRNHFRFDTTRESYLFIAGGIGITPLVGMIDSAARSGASWELVYGGRSRASMAYVDDLVGRHGDRVRVLPQDVHGLLDLDRILAAADPAGLVYCCGPEPLLAAVEQRATGWPEDRLRVERFSPRELSAAAQEEPFEVELASSGQVVTVAPGISVIDALEEQGVLVPYSCAEGTCGTCETPVLEGEIDHRDSVLTEKERRRGDVMLPCVSRALSRRITLDL